MLFQIIEFLKSNPFFADIAKGLVATVFAITFILLNALIFLYAERKLWARIMQRMGPTYVGKWGLLQLIADFIKMIGKEIVVPIKANKFAFISLPIFVTALALVLTIIMPYDYVIVNTLLVFEPYFKEIGILKYAIVSKFFESGLFLIFVLLSFTPIFILLVGWVSNNKYTVIGGFRAAAQLLSFEIPLLLAISSVIILTGSLNLYEIMDKQKNVWLVTVAPLAFVLFLITSVAEAERTPFDIPDAESEIIAGWNTEYSATPFLILILGMYVRAFISATLIAILFFGGYHGPFKFPGNLEPLTGPFWLMLKTYIFMIVLIIIRGAFPRYRIDQLLSLNWTKLLPLSIINLILVIIAKYFVETYGLL